MSIIVQDSGLLTILQTLDPEASAKGNEYNGACDRLAHQLSNQLVGNDSSAPTVEMMRQHSVIKFTEPTIIAFSGAGFNGKSGDSAIFLNRIYLFDRCDELHFIPQNNGNHIH